MKIARKKGSKPINIYIIKHYIFTCRFKTVPSLIFMDLKEKLPVVKKLLI